MKLLCLIFNWWWNMIRLKIKHVIKAKKKRKKDSCIFNDVNKKKILLIQVKGWVWDFITWFPFSCYNFNSRTHYVVILLKFIRTFKCWIWLNLYYKPGKTEKKKYWLKFHSGSRQKKIIRVLLIFLHSLSMCFMVYFFFVKWAKKNLYYFNYLDRDLF